MDISIGIMAFNEELNIGKLLDNLIKQESKDVSISEIIVISSGSNDNTNYIVRSYSRKEKRIKLIIEEMRMGKASAINRFIDASKSNILYMESADTIPKDNILDKICRPFNNREIGIVATRPVPLLTKKGILDYTVHLQWLLNHRISLNSPKFGEAIAFRKIFRKIPNTSVDEEYIAMLIQRAGLKGVYLNDVIIYNKGPKTIKDYIRQRRRIYSGHLELKKKTGYKPSSMEFLLVSRELIRIINIRNFFPTLFAVLLEAAGRTIGMFDHLTNKKHYIWKVSKTTKRLKD